MRPGNVKNLRHYSKAASRILRHRGLHGTSGEVDIDDFLHALQREMGETHPDEDWLKLIEKEGNEVRYRKEVILNGPDKDKVVGIRAIAGHSGNTAQFVETQAGTGVTDMHTRFLCHKTDQSNISSILKRGLLPRHRKSRSFHVDVNDWRPKP